MAGRSAPPLHQRQVHAALSALLVHRGHQHPASGSGSSRDQRARCPGRGPGVQPRVTTCRPSRPRRPSRFPGNVGPSSAATADPRCARVPTMTAARAAASTPRPGRRRARRRPPRPRGPSVVAQHPAMTSALEPLAQGRVEVHDVERLEARRLQLRHPSTGSGTRTFSASSEPPTSWTHAPSRRSIAGMAITVPTSRRNAGQERQPGAELFSGWNCTPSTLPRDRRPGTDAIVRRPARDHVGILWRGRRSCARSRPSEARSRPARRGLSSTGSIRCAARAARVSRTTRPGKTPRPAPAPSSLPRRGAACPGRCPGTADPPRSRSRTPPSLPRGERPPPERPRRREGRAGGRPGRPPGGTPGEVPACRGQRLDERVRCSPPRCRRP